MPDGNLELFGMVPSDTWKSCAILDIGLTLSSMNSIMKDKLSVEEIIGA